jgi:ATP-binding cassette subfamily F protein uup
VDGTYSKFIEARQAYLDSQSRLEESLRNRVRTEIEWLRRGPKARATKAKARIDNAHQLIGQLKDISARNQSSSVTVGFESTDRQTKRLVELNDVTIELGGKKIVEHLDFLITNGMRVGLVGPNGSGKTTILRLLKDELAPAAGEARKAGSLRIVYFSQTRELPESVTLRRALAPDSDSVVYQGRVVHVASYAQKFLFTGEQLNQPVERLSGGERARVLIARLMLEPADLLLLDEPTNDLDIATLEVLEESLLEYTGALVLVTHDRYMLDRVSTTVLGLDGKGSAAVFADYPQWEQWFLEQTAPKAEKEIRQESGAVAVSATAPVKKKLSYLEAREFAEIEERVEAADARLETAKARVGDPEVAVDAAKLTEALAEMETAQAEVDTLYARWAELTEKAG